MLLTCPQCRSGLQVPDGTAAKVRCPACKTIFSPAEGGEPAPEDDEDEREEPKAKPRKPDRDDEPRKKPATNARAKGRGEKEPTEANRDFDPVTEEEDRKRRKKRRREADDQLTPAERAERRAAFGRAAVGVKLIWASFGLFILSMVFFLVFFFQSAFVEPIPYFITIAGVLGLANWLLAAVGVGLCLSGPRAPGHWGYGIAAAVAVVVHLFFVLILVGQGREFTVVKADESTEEARWGYVPTRLNATMFYMAAVFYPDAGFTPKGRMVFSMVVGVAEMVRTLLIMMLLSCLARAALDEELAHRCTRAAGVASLGPGMLSLLYVGFVAAMVETNAGSGTGTLVQVLAATVQMGVYAIVVGTVFPAFVVARDVAGACDEPFQSLIPQL